MKTLSERLSDFPKLLLGSGMKFKPRQVRFQNFLQWGTERKLSTGVCYPEHTCGVGRIVLLLLKVSQGSWGGLATWSAEGRKVFGGTKVAPKKGSSSASWKQHSFLYQQRRVPATPLTFSTALWELCNLSEPQLPFLKAGNRVVWQCYKALVRCSVCMFIRWSAQ